MFAHQNFKMCAGGKNRGFIKILCHNGAFFDEKSRAVCHNGILLVTFQIHPDSGCEDIDSNMVGTALRNYDIGIAL